MLNFIQILMVSFDARGVGFLRYFQLKQLPNFLLASPILSLALCSIVYYAKSRPEIFFSLGFRASTEEKNSSAVLFSLELGPRSNIARIPEESSSKKQGITFTKLEIAF
jgi:phosphatidylinositol glycan class V